MAKLNFDFPKIDADLVIPTLARDAMAHIKTHPADPDIQENLGYPTQLVDDWQAVAVKRLGELLEQNKALKVYLDSCVKCGACSDKCHYYLGTGDPKNMPVARQDLLRKIYRRYFTTAGKYLPKLVGAEDLTEEVLDDWNTYFHQCSQCRRCAVYWPYGIETGEISMAARDIMAHIGIAQKYTHQVLDKATRVGNNLGLPQPALIDTLESLEEDLLEETGINIKLPLDKPNAEILLVTPSADFFAEPHVDGLLGYAKVFHQAGISWTLSTIASEAANFALFNGATEHMKTLTDKVYSAAKQLAVKRIVVGECGHAWRVAHNYWNTLSGPFDFLDPNYPTAQHICDFTYEQIQAGKLNIDKSQNDHIRVTYHDSCNVARASSMGGIQGGQFSIPRHVIKAVCNHFVEMRQDTTEEQTFCCGAGGGLLTDELMEVRVKGALPRMQALNEVRERDSVSHIAAICAICKSQFTTLLPMYDIPMAAVVSVHQLVSNALVFDTDQNN
ncbi:MAG: (Fe-S)-binding protein [Gammaproteobacteria bacterium]